MKGILRQLTVVLGILLLIGAVMFARSLSASKAPPPEKEPEAVAVAQVEVIEVTNSDIVSTIPIQGRIEAYNKTGIFAEVQGVLKSSDQPFKVGTYFKKGSTLLNIDQQETQYNLLAQRSALMNSITMIMPDLKIDYPDSFQQWKTYLDNFNVKQSIQPFPEALNEQEKYFIANRNLLNQYYSIKSLENRLSKYVVTAPFSGVLTKANVTPGSLVSPGQMVGELMSTANYELAATANLSNLNYIDRGDVVNLQSDDIEGSWTGKVKRFNNQVDPSTQSILVYIDVNGKNLREGMYLKGEVQANVLKNVIELPIELVNLQEKTAFVVENNKLKKMPVTIVQERGNTVILSGVKDGTTILKDRLANAFEGMEVKVLKDTSVSQNMK